MSSQECEVEGCEEATKGRYCPEHQADYEDFLYDAYEDDYYEAWKDEQDNSEQDNSEQDGEEK